MKLRRRDLRRVTTARKVRYYHRSLNFESSTMRAPCSAVDRTLEGNGFWVYFNFKCWILGPEISELAGRKLSDRI